MNPSSAAQPRTAREAPTECCGCARQRRSVADYLANPCRRVTGDITGDFGERVTAADGVAVAFMAIVVDGTVARAFYRASSCATLIAYAEVLGEMVCGRSVREAMAVAPRDLAAALPGVPPHRQDRAALVIRAWWSAVARAIENTQEASD